MTEDFEKGWEDYKAQQKQQIEEMAKDIVRSVGLGVYEKAKYLYGLGYCKIPEGSVVITKEEYEELINLQQTHADDLTNAIQSYEEDKADLKINYDNHIKNLEEIIDRQSKDLNSQANRLIGLKEKLENSRKETAEKFAERLKAKLTHPLDHPLHGIVDEIAKEITEGKK